MTARDPGPGVSTDRQDREARAYDFGRLLRRMPAAVATPGSVEEVAEVVRRAAREGVRVTVRGGGHSQGGQSLSDGGLVLDAMHLDRVRILGDGLVRAQGGAPWGKVVDALRGTRRLPAVLADIPDVTVGGTLSVGGAGTTSHRYGMQVEQVERLEVVIGTGERVRCSRTGNADLFDAVRAGQGQFGVITEAWVRLRKSGARMRQYALRYRDVDRFAGDFERVVEEDRFDHLRAEMRVHEQRIVLRAAVEYDGTLDDAWRFEGLRPDLAMTVWDTADVAQAGMVPKGFFRSEDRHPWREWLLPWETLRAVAVQPWVDPRWVPRPPRCWIGIQPIGTGAAGAPLFMRPGGERMISYLILAGVDDDGRARGLAARLREIDRTLVGLGAKAYLSGAVGYGRAAWEEHYGGMLETAVGWKRVFDPHQVFGGDGLPFGTDP